MQSTGSSRLTVRQGPAPGKIYELGKDVLTIGRDVNNDVVLNDAEVSRNHARLTAQSGGYLIEDLASTNGTFVNGQRLIGPKLLNPGDVVGLGETIVLEFNQVADAGATVVAAGLPPHVAGEPMMAPPPEPEPASLSTMAEPVISEPATMPPMAPPPAPEPISLSTGGSPLPPPAPPPPAPPPAPKRDNTMRYVGIGCGCLALCGCIGLLAVVWTNLGAIRTMLGL
ncbi:MAG: FHA domain-containing protein [Anaerolineales bacterium]|nr:FHA domain-containing protein [Anaerolineales bacterium]